jgi:hypothetical protein
LTTTPIHLIFSRALANPIAWTAAATLSSLFNQIPTTRRDFMTTRRVRLGILGIGLAGAMMMRPGDIAVKAQETNRGEDAAVSLAGRKVRIDKNSGKLRDLSQQEARELISTLTAMTTRTERAAAAPGGSTLDQIEGFDHVVVGRPNEDGTVEVRCVGSVEEAVSFLSQQPKSSGKE